MKSEILTDQKFLVFGDSIACGAWDDFGGWVDRFRVFLRDKKEKDPDYYWMVYNLGIDADTSTGILKRFEDETRPRLWPEEETVIIFAFGKNDSAYTTEKSDYLVPLEEFKENIKELKRLASKYSEKVVFIGPHLCDDSKTNPVPWKTDLYYKAEKLKDYNEVLKDECKDELFLDLQAKIKDQNGFLSYDGLHPSTEGHARIFKEVKEFLEENKVI